MSRMNKILALVLAVQLALVVYVFRPGQENVPPKVQFFSDIEAGQVTGLSIADQKQAVTVTREGDAWVIDSTQHYPADKGKVEKLVQKLLGLTSSRLVARTRASHGRLKVGAEDFNRKLTLHLGKGDDRILLLGSAPNYKTIHVRRANDDEVYLVKDLADWEAQADPHSWWDTNYIDVKPEDLQQVTLTNGHGRLELHRGADKQWQARQAAAGMALADEALTDFLNRVSLIQLDTYLERGGAETKYGLDKPVATLELITTAGAITLKVAKGDAKDEEYFMKSSDSPFVVRASGYQVKGLLDATLGELLKSTAKQGNSK